MASRRLPSSSTRALKFANTAKSLSHRPPQAEPFKHTQTAQCTNSRNTSGYRLPTGSGRCCLDHLRLTSPVHSVLTPLRSRSITSHTGNSRGMVYKLQFGCAASIHAASLILILIVGASHSTGQTNSEQSRPACSCPDGRQFSTGSSLFGKNSARVVITGFRRDLAQSAGQSGLPPCKDLAVVGQTIQLEALAGHPFLRRENRKRGTIA